jgi:hypothetical protein
MENSQPNQIKILTRFYNDLLGKEIVETMWATVVDKEKGYYKIQNSPFYAKSIAFGDIVFAEYDESEQAITYRRILEYSGNSTIQIVILDKSVTTDEIRNIFDSLGCSSEKFKEGYFVIDVPAQMDYSLVKQCLINLSDKGQIDFAEACLSDKHIS